MENIDALDATDLVSFCYAFLMMMGVMCVVLVWDFVRRWRGR